MSNKKSYEIAFELGASMNSSMRTAFNNAQRALGNTESQVTNLNNSSGALNKTLGAVSATAVAAGAAFAAVTAGLGLAVSATEEYDVAMRQIESSTKVSVGQMAEIREMSKNLYNANLGEDWADLAEAISTTQSVTKLTGEVLENATANALIYRDTFGEEVSQSIKAADTMMRNFGITADQSFNLLAQGAQNGLNKSDELIDSANEYAPYFATLGFNANQMFDVFATGLDKGAFNLDKVGDAIKEFGIRSKDGSKLSIESFEMLGMSGEKMTKTFAAGGPAAQKAFKEVAEAIKNVKDPVDQNAIAVGLFGTQAEDLEMNVISSLANVRSQFDMTKMTMEQIKNIKYDTMGMAFQGIRRQVETGVLIPIGEKLLPVITNLSKSFAKNMPAIEKFVTDSIDKVGAAFNKVREFAGLFKEILPDKSTMSGAFSQIIDVARTTIGKLAPIFSTIVGIVGPILIDAVNFIKGIFSQITTFWNENGAQIIQAVQNVFSAISKVVQFLAPVVFFILKSVWQNVKGVIQGGLDVILGLVKTFASLFTGDWSGMWEGIKQMFGGALEFLWNLWNLLMIGKLLGSVKALAQGFWNFLKGIGQSISTNVQFYYYQFTSAFYRIAGSILKAIGNAIGSVIGIVRNGVNNFIQVFTMARTFGVNVFMSIVSAVRNVFSSVFGTIRTAFSSLVSTVGGFFSSIWGFLQTLWTNIATIFSRIQYAMINPFNTVRSVVSSVVQFISGLIKGMFDGVVSTGRGAINGLIMAANAVIGGLNSLSVDIPDWVPKFGGQSFGLSIPSIPMLAQGGITTGPTLAMIGEGAEQEAVLPLSKLEGLLNTSTTNQTNNRSSNSKYVYAPVYHVAAGTDLNELKRIDKENQIDFERRITEHEDRNDRLSLA